jgi:glutathionyl-hydroquinone reductase
LYAGDVLFDKQRNTTVSNELSDIVRMLNSSFGALADNSFDLYPADLAAQIDALNEHLYYSLNNGVYNAGFASTQQAYEEACLEVFQTLDEL